jgi:hypothetical protein
MDKNLIIIHPLIFCKINVIINTENLGGAKMDQMKKIHLLESKQLMYVRGLRQARKNGESVEAIRRWEDGIRHIKEEISSLQLTSQQS